MITLPLFNRPVLHCIYFPGIIINSTSFYSRSILVLIRNYLDTLLLIISPGHQTFILQCECNLGPFPQIFLLKIRSGGGIDSKKVEGVLNWKVGEIDTRNLIQFSQKNTLSGTSFTYIFCFMFLIPLPLLFDVKTKIRKSRNNNCTSLGNFYSQHFSFILMSVSLCFSPFPWVSPLVYFLFPTCVILCFILSQSPVFILSPSTSLKV